MATCTLQNVFDAARGYLRDTQVSGGETWTNTNLQVHFAEAYRRLFNALSGVSKRVQHIAYVTLPANTTVLIPAAYGITDFAEPEVIEERAAPTAITLTSCNTATPIVMVATAHGLGTAGQMVEGTVAGVSGTAAPLGRWFATIIDANDFSLNGSVGDVAGTGGTFTPWSQLPFTEVQPIDLAEQGLDGVPQQALGVYLWANEQLQFRGASQPAQLRMTYWASGSPPSNSATIINIDNSIDFLAGATAANAARASQWFALADQLKFTAFGASQEADGLGGLLGDFIRIQVLTMQRGPQRRQLPFREKRERFGSFILG